MTTKISTDNIQAGALATLGSNPKITQIQICDSSYNVLDDTAIALGGGYVKITGTGFKSGASVTVNRTLATSVTWISSTELRAEVGPQVAGTYVVYVVNTDGSVAIRINALTYSSEPSWTTGSTLIGDSGTAISIQLAATPAVSYSLAAGSTLPTGLTLTSGGLLSGTVNIENETVYSFSVIATDTELQDSPRTFSLTISVGDLYFAATTLLLPGSANTFVRDASTNNFALTVVGDTKPNNFGPYTPGYYSAYFDAKTDYISVPATTSLTTFTGDFTFEAWIYPSDTSITYWGIWDSRQSGATAQAMVFLIDPLASPVTGQGRMRYFNGTSYYGTGIVYYNRWTHVAFVRSGTTMTFYIDGVASGTATVSGTQTGTATTNPIWIGAKDNGSASYGSTGYISNFRIVNGTAVYTSNFTPSTAPLTAITNTVLLTCQSNRFIDNSTNNYTLTPSSASISGFVPYAPNSSYSTYGSAYFDGTGDNLSIASNAAFGFGTGDFTIECWVYPTVNARQDWIDLTNGTERVLLYYSGTAIVFYSVPSNAAAITGPAMTLNTWTHLALSKQSGNSKLFVNGVQVGSTYTVNQNYTASMPVSIGKDTAGTTYVTGYMSDVRIVKGTAVYTANFTPPTQPLTAVTGTSLLTLQNNTPVANNTFLDSSSNNLLVTRAGNATQGTFSPYSPSGWSNYFDGTGDFLTVGSSANLALGAGNWTVESWIYPTSVAIAQNIIADWRNSNSDLPVLYMVNNQVLWRESSATRITSSSTLNANTWYHVAVAKVSTTTTMYINGVSVGSYTDTTNYSNADFKIGKAWDSNHWNGYISNLRIVRGTAVYTANFTPPAQPLTAIAGTSLLTCADNRFIDESPNNFALTRAGDTRVTNFSPFKAVVQTPVSYSAYFDGTGDYLQVTSGNVSDFGTADFTIECWINPSRTATYQGIFESRPNTTDGLYPTILLNNSNVAFWVSGAARIAGAFTINTWTHVAVVRNSGISKMYLNGTQIGSSYTDTNNYITRNDPYIGSLNAGGNVYAGHISNLRIVKGTAVYTENFTPSTAPLTAIAGTSLLTCQSPSFVDNSSNHFAITAAGNSQPTTVNPFGSTFVNSTGYSAAEYSGSMYFDGTGDYLSSPSNAAIGTGPFTIEFWMYPAALGTERHIIDNGYWSTGNNGGYRIAMLAANTIQLLASTGTYNTFPTVITSSTALPSANQWYHIAVVRNSSNSIMIYINGVPAATAVTYASSLNLGGGQTFKVGGVIADNALQANPYIGYISNLRIISGTAVYPSSFVPPIAPVTPVQNTTLLLNGTSAAIADATTKNVLETVGNVKISNAVSKFGGSSMSFDGTGDWIQVAGTNPSLAFGTGAFTLEFWFYSLAASGTQQLFDTRPAGTSSTSGYMALTYSGSLNYYTAGGNPIAGGTVSANAWHHVALTRSGTSTRLFVDGVQVGSTYTDTQNYLNGLNRPIIGADGNAPSASLSGYIQDVRITRGIARYTANFTAPTSALQIK